MAQAPVRQAHLAEVIKGWYANFERQTMSRATQNGDFIPYLVSTSKFAYQPLITSARWA